MDQEIKDKSIHDLTSGSITKSIFYLAGPVVTTMFLETAFSLANIFWVGKLGAVSLAAVISSTILVWIIYSLMGTISVGVTALVSRSIGAKDLEQASSVARQAYLFAILVALILSVLGIFFSHSAFVLMGTEPEVTRLGSRYLRIIFSGAVFLFLIDVFGATFRASGNTKTPMLVTLGSVGLNILLDPFLIFGWGPFPRMETSGAALASIISQCLGCGLLGFLIVRGRLGFKFSLLPKLKLHFATIWRILRIGIPASIAWITFSIVYLFLNKIVAHFGTEDIAALGVGNRMESISYLTCFGFSVAASTLVGQNLGAGKPERSSRAVWQTAWIVALITGVVSIMFFIFPQHITSFFISDPKVVQLGTGYLRILALSQVFMGLEIVFEGAFAGAGNTVPPMVISLSGSLARIPLAYFLALHTSIGVAGVWWAISLTSVIKGIISTYWFSRGGWKNRNI